MRLASTDDVREYYDRNNASFLRFGQGRGTATIRRSIRAPGVKTKSDAFHYVDAEIARRLELDKGERCRVLDLGCGVGGSLVWLAERFDIEGIGVTLSPVQAGVARELLAARVKRGPLRGKVEIVAADLHDFAPSTAQDAAFAIESFQLVADASRFFRHVASLLRPAGTLVVVDDFLAKDQLTPAEARIVDDFRRGWRVRTLMTLDRTAEVARAEGLELGENLDLTPYLELGRPRDVVIRQLVRPMRLFPSLDRRPALANLIGGDALQRGLESGVFTHRFMLFRRGA
jgi:cyclopropane fatty-acyl-phospholipid synthase-like methyltransferase